MRERTQQIRKISKALQGKRLIWFGVRGLDARPLLALPEFTHCFSRVGPLRDPSLEADECLETIAGVRVDHNLYDADKAGFPEEAVLRARLTAAVEPPSVIFPYKSEALLSELAFVTGVHLLGMFHEHQAIFDHKPWVETELDKAGVSVLPWRYVSNDDPRRLRVLGDALRDGPLALRANRSRGGAGLRVAYQPADLDDELGADDGGFTAYSPFFAEGIPLNTGACVFPDGSVTLHSPSVQLIGIPALTNRVLGYCGNDFASVGQLDAGVLDAYEEMTLRTGAWLHAMGYIGSFGVDALVDGGSVYLVEVNPRFQGSSANGARLAQELDLPDVYTDHLAALLGFEATARRPLRELAVRQGRLAQVIAYNQTTGMVRHTGEGFSSEIELGLLPAPEVSVQPNAALFKAVLPGPVTRDGLHLDPQPEALVRKLAESLFEPAEEC